MSFAGGSILSIKIGFLFNHDSIHQISHTAPIISEIARMGGNVTVIASGRAQIEHLTKIMGDTSGVELVHIDIGRVAKAVDVLARQIIPFRRIASLRENLKLFSGFDALVVPETTSALLKSHFGLKQLKLIYLPHGAGDRSVGFRDVTRFFDLVLLPGAKTRDRMLERNLVRPDNHAVVGYPKFDIIDLADRKRFFDNDRPTVLYNPHFDPRLSSWWDMGLQVLEWFARQEQYNLIFAPHIMLFQKRFHTSVEHRKLRRRIDIPEKYRHLPHIRIDEGSSHSVDMSYTRSADIYLGDASSQVYEWIYHPRSCIFLNGHAARWQDNPDYAHWELGQVIDRVADLPAALEKARTLDEVFRTRQTRAFEQTFSLQPDRTSAQRAAEAIMSFLSSGSVSRDLETV
ncbi:hypothetical protein CFR71_02020 [Novacetimonas pomaceti]|uniref:Uncharacterized protein n=2 Tax=Novacetimonas pomaceti TaxID=2021998 RepID=A0A318QW78_9PROT|nr:hypothetical protein CFR71_02020 [Novacetimonas pomaceti]